ncbi:MAG: sigma-70 family RNA polymerase sigma factor [Acidobacteria bacterium]|nr:sigma-70 family RNA polymerase sigma factor [Acidobacteriota bacterium]
MSEISWPAIERLIGARAPEPATAVQNEVARLFAEYRAPLLRYLHSLGVTLPEGEDVVQEAFLALYCHLLRDRPSQSLPAWIFRVARNLATDRMRDSARDAVTPEALVVADTAASPEEQAAGESEGRRIRAVAAALPEIDRQCLYLRAEGLRYREIAEALGISLGSVALSLERSFAKLARATGKAAL